MGAGGGDEETKPTEARVDEGVPKEGCLSAWLLSLAKEGSQATPRVRAE